MNVIDIAKRHSDLCDKLRKLVEEADVKCTTGAFEALDTGIGIIQGGLNTPVAKTCLITCYHEARFEDITDDMTGLMTALQFSYGNRIVINKAMETLRDEMRSCIDSNGPWPNDEKSFTKFYWLEAGEEGVRCVAESALSTMIPSEKSIPFVVKMDFRADNTDSWYNVTVYRVTKEPNCTQINRGIEVSRRAMYGEDNVIARDIRFQAPISYILASQSVHQVACGTYEMIDYTPEEAAAIHTAIGTTMEKAINVVSEKFHRVLNSTICQYFVLHAKNDPSVKDGGSFSIGYNPYVGMVGIDPDIEWPLVVQVSFDTEGLVSFWIFRY